MAKRKQLRVALVDADETLCHEIKNEFTEAGEGWHVDSYSCAQHALADILSSPPHAVLLDVTTSSRYSTTYARKLKSRLPELPVIILDSGEDAGSLLSAMTAGANGYLMKPLRRGDLMAGLNKAMTGGMSLCQRAERLLLEGLRRMGSYNAALPLTRREQEIMAHLINKQSDKEIASSMRIAQSTVHAHMAKIFKKLNTHDRNSAVVKYYNSL